METAQSFSHGCYLGFTVKTHPGWGMTRSTAVYNSSQCLPPCLAGRATSLLQHGKHKRQNSITQSTFWLKICSARQCVYCRPTVERRYQSRAMSGWASLLCSDDTRSSSAPFLWCFHPLWSLRNQVLFPPLPIFMPIIFISCSVIRKIKVDWLLFPMTFSTRNMDSSCSSFSAITWLNIFTV